MAEDKQVSMQSFESEFGLKGNTDAAEADAVVEVANNQVDVDALDKLAGQKKLSDMPSNDSAVRAVEQILSEEEAFAGLDDNVAIMEKRAELDGARAAEAEEGEGEELEAQGGEAEGEEAGEDEDAGERGEVEEGGEGEAAAEEEGEAAADDGGDGEGAGAAGGEDEADAADDAAGDLDPVLKWLRKSLPDPETRSDLAQAMVEEGVEISYQAAGKTVREPLSEIIKKAAGYAGEQEVSARSQAAKAALKNAEKMQADAEAAAEQAQAMVDGFKTKIDDVKWMGQFLTSTATPEYMAALRDTLDSAVRDAEDNPGQFIMSRRMGRIESVLQDLSAALSGGQPAARREASGDRDTDEGAATDGPQAVPEDMGFQRGVGYPASTSTIVRSTVQAYLEGASAQEVGVTYDDVVKAWNEEGRTRQLRDVAKGLVGTGRRQRQKRGIDADPPTPRTPGKGRGPRGKKPSGDSRSKPGRTPSWDEIEGIVAKEVAAVNQGSELQS